MAKKADSLIFIALAYGLAWVIWLGLWLAGIPLGKPISQFGTMLAMWMPALAFFMLKKIRSDEVKLKSCFSLKLKNHWSYYLLALWLPAVLSLLGIAIYFLVFQNQFSLGFEGLEKMLETAGVTGAIPSVQLIALLQVFSAATYAPFLNSLLALGEEIGWRGYLYPALRERFSMVESHLLTGLIWSLWHFPINLQGYNYGLTYLGYPWLGLVAMFVFCFSIGVILSWLMEKTGSLWAPALFHGAVNACAGLGLLFQLSSEKALALRILGPPPSGLLASLPFLVVALAILQKERKTEDELR